MYTGVTAEWESFTVQDARDLLATSEDNRSRRPAFVNALARDMRTGNFNPENGETVKISASGRLMDGQHRIAAQIAADVTMRYLVVRGVEESAIDTIDAGVKRRFSDLLKMRGEKNYASLATATRAIAGYSVGNRWLRADVTNAEQEDVLIKYPWIRDSLPVVSLARKTAGLPAPTGALCYWMFWQIDPEDCVQFFQRLIGGTGLYPGSPLLALRRILLNWRDAGTRPEIYYAAIMIKAWNAYREHRSVQLLRYAVTDEFPIPH